MQCKRRYKVVYLATILLLLTSAAGNARGQSASNSHDLAAEIRLFDNYSKDFNSMEQPSQGETFETLNFLEGVAATAEDRLAAADAELKMYDSIKACAGDRQAVRKILVDRLRFYIWAFDKEITRENGGLTFVKVPAEAEEGLRMKDDLRLAKERLESILTSLQ